VTYSRRDWVNLPNLITLVRIVVVPLFMWILLSHSSKSDPLRWFAVLLFVAAIATDGVDGAIARKLGLVTNLGKILDPVADKALIGGAMVGLSLIGELSWTITVIILLREVGITVYRMVVVRKRVIAANAGGKLKTILQGILFGFLLSPLDFYWTWLTPLEGLLLLVTVAVTLWTGAVYLREALAKNHES
jgi:CDP-diacylglycerol--glycerol-3-phosphate 3-phosphatidyltransferase